MKISALVFAGALALPVVPRSPGAAAVPSGEAGQFSLHEDQALERPAFLTGRSVSIAGIAKDDLFVVAQRLELAGRAENDLWAAGESIAINGDVRDHARLAGTAVVVRGRIGNGLWAIGNGVQIAEGAVVGGPTTIWGRDVVLDGELSGPVTVNARSVTLAGFIRGDVRLMAEEILALPTARIEGDFIYTAPNEFTPDSRVKIAGEVVRIPAAPQPAASGLALLLLLAAFLVGIPFVLLFPRFAGRGARAVRESFWSSLMVGAVAGGLLPLVIVFAALIVVGIPLALVLAAGMGIFLYLAQFPVALAFGGLLLRRRGPQPPLTAIGALAVGLVALHLLPLIPFAGPLIRFGATLLGFGALLRALGGDRPQPPPLPFLTPPAPPSADSMTSSGDSET